MDLQEQPQDQPRQDNNVLAAEFKQVAKFPREASGTFAGRYEIVEKIGIGGMAALYKVRDLIAGDELAIKIIRPEIASNDEIHKRFRQEARAARDLNHPNIVSVHTYDISEGVPYIIMDFVDGIDLGKVLRKSGPLAVPLFFPIFVQVTGALVHAHSRGVVHRDVKPSNILITTTADGEVRVKLVDFGIAKLLYPTAGDEDTHVLTQPGQTMGSPSYMSPEQVQGKLVDARSDIYSLGCVMFEAIAGRLPFVADSALQLAMNHVYNQPINLKKVTKNCPLHLDRIVSHCLEKEPDNRYQNMFDLRSDLQLIAQGKEPLLRTANTTSSTPIHEDWLEVFKKDAPKDFTSVFKGRLSYDVRLNNILEQINELGYPGDSILKLQSQNPPYTGVIIIRDGRKVVSARLQSDRVTTGYEALRKLVATADGEFHYFTIQRDDFGLPDTSFMLNLKYILSLYPNLPESPMQLEDENAIRDLVFAVESNTRTDWDEVTPIDRLMDDMDGRDDRWRPMGALKDSTPTPDFLSREQLVDALAREAAARSTTTSQQSTFKRMLRRLVKRGTGIVMVIVFLLAMVSMGTVIVKQTWKGAGSTKSQVRKKRPSKRSRRHSHNFIQESDQFRS
ncbi:MAG: serine/threonine protein kinase [Candidatus Obscuribacterales bacterium]|nr:serine/threonine protein kinase [Candidatus Obscuribacterales bacterium]